MLSYQEKKLNNFFSITNSSKKRIMCISDNLCKTIRYLVNDYANAVGAPLHITPHMFRHTFATELHNEDVDIRYIQQFLGHSSIATTQIYTHISTSKTREILESKHPRNKMNLFLHKYKVLSIKNI